MFLSYFISFAIKIAKFQTGKFDKNICLQGGQIFCHCRLTEGEVILKDFKSVRLIDDNEVETRRIDENSELIELCN